jgi:hypothetical protein
MMLLGLYQNTNGNNNKLLLSFYHPLKVEAGNATSDLIKTVVHGKVSWIKPLQFTNKVPDNLLLSLFTFYIPISQQRNYCIELITFRGSLKKHWTTVFDHTFQGLLAKK